MRSTVLLSLLLLCLALLGQSCITSALIADAVYKNKQKNRIEDAMKQAEAKGPLAYGQYRIEDLKDEIEWEIAEDYFKSHNYYIFDANKEKKKIVK
ncbi:MAG: hypothetical protein IK092_03590, partial [Muribaculaceae bacterium]|nr:hypothetical protein [Muribaculaceae bacterium]